MTYAELIVEVSEWMDRNDLTGKAPLFVELATDFFNHTLRLREMETKVTLTVVNNEATLPADFVYLKEVITDCDYNVHGSVIELEDQTLSEVVIRYYQRLSDLSTSQTNVILEKYPKLYLTASKVQAAEYVRDQALMAEQNQIMDSLMLTLDRSDFVGRHGTKVIEFEGVG